MSIIFYNITKYVYCSAMITLGNTPEVNYYDYNYYESFPGYIEVFYGLKQAKAPSEKPFLRQRILYLVSLDLALYSFVFK